MSRTALLAVCVSVLAARASASSPHRPYVVDSLPKDGQVDVDPSMNTIAVAFSREMSTRRDGWVGTGPTYPTVTGRSFWDRDRRLCRLPVRLTSGRCYVVGINEGTQSGFRGRHGAVALPYAIVFATRGFDTGATPLPFAWVEETVPSCGASAVPPGRTTLRIRLSRPVKGGTGPWQRYGTAVPAMLSLPLYGDHGCAVQMDVMLRAACEYAVDIDTRCHPGLVTPTGQAVLPYWLAFRTADHRQQGTFDRPVVVDTAPPMGSETVDPARTAVAVRFSMPLRPGSLRVDRHRGVRPEITVPPRLDADRRRCVLGVRLKPATVYVLGINLRPPNTFHSMAGRPAVPFLWAFATRRGLTQTEAIPYPRVVALAPAHGATDVSCSIKQMRVVFSEPMRPAHSLVGQGGLCPSPIGQPVWSPDRRTITWRVRLQRHAKYRFSLNSRWYRNFRSERGIPCRPTVIAFKTGN